MRICTRLPYCPRDQNDVTSDGRGVLAVPVQALTLIEETEVKMYPVMAFPLYLEGKDNPTVEHLYDSVQEDLREALQAPSDEWPNSQWKFGPEGKARSDEWVEETCSDTPKVKLLNVHIEIRIRDLWFVDLRVGQTHTDSLAFYGQWRASSYQVTTPINQLPTLSVFHSYSCRNEDGLLAGKTYVVCEERVDSFVEFLESSERRLPVFLTSCLPDDSGFPLPNIGKLARAAQGLAHVMKLEDHRAAQALLSRLPNHGCYGGAVRLYWPNFRADAASHLYPFWHPDRVQAAGEAVSAAVFEKIVEQSPRIIAGNPDIEYLERQRTAQRNRKRLDTLKQQTDHLESEQRQKLAEADMDKAALEEQIELLESGQHEWDEFFASYEELERQNNSLREENFELEQKVRTLEWHLNRAKIGPEEPPPADTDEPDHACIVYLSSRARKTYTGLGPDERQYWNEHIFAKLVTDQMRDNQSEPVASEGKTCWVYPRSRTAAGRRLVYYTTQQRINVCEIFTKDEHDERYEKLREQGIDHRAYGDFEAWPVGSTQ